MKKKNLFSNIRMYNFSNPKIVSDFLEADLPLASIMIKRASNLKHLRFKTPNGDESLLRIVNDLDKLKILLDSDTNKYALYESYIKQDGYKHLLSTTDDIEKAKMIIDFYNNTGSLEFIANSKNVMEEAENPEIIKLLIKAGLNINKGHMHGTVLERVQNKEKFDLLIENRVKINALTKSDIPLYAHFTNAKTENIILKNKDNNKYYSERLYSHIHFDPNFADKKGNPVIFHLIKDEEKQKIIRHPDFDPNVKIDNQPSLYFFKDKPDILNALLQTKKIELEKQKFQSKSPFIYLNDFDYLSKLYKSEENTNYLINSYDSKNNKLLFSNEISLDKFKFILDKTYDFYSEPFYENDQHLLIHLSKNNELSKIRSLLDKDNSLTEDITDKYGNNILAYITQSETLNKMVNDYGLDLKHTNNFGNYSLIEGLSKIHSSEYAVIVKLLLDEGKLKEALDKVESAYSNPEPGVLLDKSEMVKKLKNEEINKDSTILSHK